MVFSSILFLLVFLPAFLLVYHLVKHKYRNIVLLSFSIVFYAWGAPKFIFLLLASLTANYYIVQEMSRNEKRQKLLMIASLCINIGLLGFFKYTNFFVDNFNTLLTAFNISNIAWTQIALPIGISFFTFQSITYTIDVYRKVHKPLENLHDYILYILMFPQLIAGPIVRFHTVADEIIDRRQNESYNDKLNGIYLFVIGLSKKVLIANVLGEFVDTTFNGVIAETATGTLWLTMIAYSFQIYFDFSGYSDMAIGLGRMIGFHFPENFNNPYISQNITEFWRRWHITLGQVMKNYLYIPLGGNRVATKRKLYFNLILVFLISGFWHGAEWTFIIWGAWHGLFLILDRIFLIKLFSKIGKIPRIILNYTIIIIGWVFFRAANITEALKYLKGMFSFNTNLTNNEISLELIVILIIATVFSFSGANTRCMALQKKLYSDKNSLKAHALYFIIAVTLFVICTAYITSSGFNPFIYFRF